MAHLTRFVLTAPVQGPVFDRIDVAYKDLDGFIAALKDKDIDTLHFESVRRDLDEMESRVRRYEMIVEAPDAQVVRVDDGLYRDLRAYRIYFRALLLEKLDELDAWKPKPKKERAK